MVIKSLPKTITKGGLFEKAQERFAYWARMYGDSNVTVQQLYEDMSCSVFPGDPEYDFPEQFKPKKEMQEVPND